MPTKRRFTTTLLTLSLALQSFGGGATPAKPAAAE